MSPLEDGTVFSRTSFRRDHRAQLVTRLVRAALAANPSRLSAGGAVLAVPTSDALCRAGMSSRDLHSIDVDRTALARPHRLVPTTPDPASTGDRLKCRLDETRAPSAGFSTAPLSGSQRLRFARLFEGVRGVTCTLSPAGLGHPVEVTRRHLLLLSALGGWNPFSFEVGRPSSWRTDKMPLSDFCNRLPTRASARRSTLETQPRPGFPRTDGRETDALPFLGRGAGAGPTRPKPNDPCLE